MKFKSSNCFLINLKISGEQTKLYALCIMSNQNVIECRKLSLDKKEDKWFDIPKEYWSTDQHHPKIVKYINKKDLKPEGRRTVTLKLLFAGKRTNLSMLIG